VFIVTIVTGLSCLAAPIADSGRAAGLSPAGIEVVFLAGEGFLVQYGRSKVLVDALFDLSVEDGKPPRAHDHLDPDGLARLERAERPFDKVDAVLVTHRHDDHFTPASTARYMRSNSGAVLAGTREVTEALTEFEWLAGEEGERLITPDVSSGGVDTLIIDGLTIYALKIMHTGCESDYGKAAGDPGRAASPCIDHLAWLVEMEGCRILHLGDAKVAAEEFERFPWLPGLEVDIAFIPYWFLLRPEGVDLINRLISPKAVVLMHWNRWNRASVVEDLDRLRDVLPPTTIFKEAFEKMRF
jgi:L-ascorbate metabolism protein UlaG (beta-lactamase superfamily)